MTDIPKKSASHPSRPDEHFEPYELHNGMPWLVLLVAIALGIWGTLTLFETRHYANFVDLPEKKPAAVAAGDKKETVYVDAGTALFDARCATCHQPDGLGVRGAVPPLHSSPFVKQGSPLIAQIMLRGIDGPIRVNHSLYDGHMPSFASVLSDQDIALLAQHVSTRFGGSEASSFSDTDVKAIRQKTADLGSFNGGQEVAQSAGLDVSLQPKFQKSSAPSVSADISALVFAGTNERWACASCHGDLGQGNENTPRLAGLPAAYIVKQLNDFVTGTRQNESMRVVAATLSAEQIQNLAAYYSIQRVPSNAKAELGGDLARGETLALYGDWSRNVPACFSCHGPSGFGVSPEFPGLAAQQASYTAGQLAAWAGGYRQNSPLSLMDHISKQLTDADRRAVADYLATLPPVPASSSLPLINATRGEKP